MRLTHLVILKVLVEDLAQTDVGRFGALRLAAETVRWGIFLVRWGIFFKMRAALQGDGESLSYLTG